MNEQMASWPTDAPILYYICCGVTYIVHTQTVGRKGQWRVILRQQTTSNAALPSQTDQCFHKRKKINWGSLSPSAHIEQWIGKVV